MVSQEIDTNIQSKNFQSFHSKDVKEIFFLIGIVAAIMSWFIPGVPIFRLISLVFFLLGVIGSLLLVH